jgi:UDP-N-acetylmuramate-alanine ligase
MESFDEVIKYIEKKTHNGDVILTLGAGDVYTLIDRLI